MRQSCILEDLRDDQDKRVQYMVCQMRKNADLSGLNVSEVFRNSQFYFHWFYFVRRIIMWFFIFEFSAVYDFIEYLL